MPSKTFFNLPEGKRNTLLAAAREEFTRVSFAQASINKIIQQAGIPRGSFYMYFEDKEDLFRYLIQQSGSIIFQRLEQRIYAVQGDLLLALRNLIDDAALNATPSQLKELFDIFHCNADLQPGAILSYLEPQNMLSELLLHIDWSNFNIPDDEAKGDLLHMLASITGPALMEVAFGSHPLQARRRYLSQLNLLAQGIQAP